MDLGPIITIVIVVVSFAAFAPMIWWAIKLVGNLQKSAAEEQRLLQTGTPAQGQILAAQPTGTLVNNNPQVMFTILVTPPGGQPYQVQLTKLVSMFEMAQYQVGMACQVRIDPMNPQKIAILGGGGMMGGAPMGGMPGAMPMGGAPMGGMAMGGMPGAPQAGWPGAPQQGVPMGGAPQAGWPGAPQGGPPPGQGGWGGPGQGGPGQGGWGR